MTFMSMSALIDDIKRVDEYDQAAEYERIFRKVVSVRLDASEVATLEGIAKQWGISRTACAERLLETAIFEVSMALGLSRSYNMSADESGNVTVTPMQGGEPVLVKDDALIIAGGDDK